MSTEEYSRQGYEQLQKEEYEQARSFFQRALAEESAHPDSLYGIARAHFKLEAFDKSIQAFDRLINLVPNNAMFYSERGVALHWTGNNDLALADFDKAVALEPENPYRYSSRAYIKDRLKDYQGAIDDYTKAIALDPEDAIAYNNRGMIEEKLGYIQQSKRSYQQADVLDQQKNGKPQPAPAERNYEVPPVTQTVAQQKKSGSGAYWQEMQSVFTSRQQFKEFVQFVFRPFRKS